MVDRLTVRGWWLLAALILIAFALRLFQLDAVPLRGDEAYTAIHWTNTPFSDRWLALIEFEPNPGSLLLYWAWSEGAGLSEFALRYLSLSANVFGLAVMVALVYRLQWDWRVALLVGLLWAVNPFFIWHGQDARQYGPLTALTPLNMLLFLRALHHDRRRDWTVYLLLQTATIYIYYLELFWVAVQGFYLLSLRNRHVLRRTFTVWAVMAVLLVPLAVQTYIVAFVQGYEGTAATAEVAALFTDFLPTLLFGENAWPLIVGVIVAAGLLVSVWMWARVRVLLIAWLMVPLIMLTLVSTQADLFLPRYVIAVAPAVLVAVALAITGLADALHQRTQTRILRPLIIVAGVILLVLPSLVEVRDYFANDPSKAADWPGLVDYFTGRVTAADVLISDSIDPALEYYYTGPARILFIPEDNPPPQAYVPDALAGQGAVYVLAGSRTGPAAQFLQAQAQPIPGDDWPGVSQFRPWQVDPGEIADRLAWRLGEVATLRGHTLLGDDTLLLYWEAHAQTAVDHSVLLHIATDADSPPVAVLDHGIAGAVVSTRAWEPGTLYRDPVALPDLPAGEYTVFVGMYPVDTGTRLQRADDAGFDGRYPLTTFIIE